MLKRARYVLSTRLGRSGIPASREVLYGIRAGYRHRLDNRFYDDTPADDSWQREVYEAAAVDARGRGARAVYDVGCGSGYKLVKYFSEFHTVGFDLEPTVEFLKGTYPDRRWRVSNLEETFEEPADIVICADVVEHVPDPDRLMRFLSRLQFRKLYLSTPERLLVYGFDHSGPPGNPAHCREWRMDEFNRYVARWFEIERHEISNRLQGTQLIVCRPRQ